MDLGVSSAQKMIRSFQSQDKTGYHVVFRIDRQHYALPLDRVLRAVRMVAFTPVPDAPHYVLGLINMAGQMLPVIDLRQLLGQTGKRPELQDFLLIVQIQEQAVAVVVDEVLNILQFTSKQVQPPPATVSQSGFLAAAVRQDDLVILVLDASRILASNGERMADGVAR